jgi:hypothetical protein
MPPCTYIRTYVGAYIRTYIGSYIRTYIGTYMRACTFQAPRISCIYIYIYIYTYIHTYIYIYIYTHTHIHTYIRTHIAACSVGRASPADIWQTLQQVGGRGASRLDTCADAVRAGYYAFIHGHENCWCVSVCVGKVL